MPRGLIETGSILTTINLVRSSQMLGVIPHTVADLHAAHAAVFAAGVPAQGGMGVHAVAAALLVHAGSKSLAAWVAGGPSYLHALAPGLWLHTLLVAVGIIVLSA